MDIEYFVNNYIKREKRERLMYEFKKKPQEAYSRFCHGVQEILDERCVVLSGEKWSEEEVLLKLKKHTKDKEAYIQYTEFNGQTRPLKEAVQICFDWLGGSVLITNGAIFCKEEQCFGAPNKYVLAKN